MAKNIVFITAFDREDEHPYRKYCFLSWRQWCEKNDAQIFIFERDVNFTTDIPLEWKRFFYREILDELGIEFNQIALVDMDTMAHPLCPNFFEITEGKIGVVSDYDDPERTQNSLNFYLQAMDGVSCNWDGFFNVGVMVANSNHSEFFAKCYEKYNQLCNSEVFLRERLQESAVKLYDHATLINIMAKELQVELKYLPKLYNITRPHSKSLMSRRFAIEVSGIWHFVDCNVDMRNDYMERFWGDVVRR